VETIAHSIILTVDETGTIDYGQRDHNNLVLNTLETHLLLSHQAILHDTPDEDDIVSLDNSSADMDVVYQKDITFTDIALKLAPITSQKGNKADTKTAPTDTNHPHYVSYTQQKTDVSKKPHHYNTPSDVTVTQITDHMISSNTNDVVDVSAVVDQVVASRGEPKKLSDSIHAPKGSSIVSLPPNDLCHRINALRHKPPCDQPGFLLIQASSL